MRLRRFQTADLSNMLQQQTWKHYKKQTTLQAVAYLELPVLVTSSV